MNVTGTCPGCQQPVRFNLAPPPEEVRCGCGWSRPVRLEGDAAEVSQCVLCGCRDLWRQKDFPPQLGVALVALGAALSTVAYAWRMHLAALGILLAFALVDLLLYTFMGDVLVCYRCGARYRRTGGGAAEHFDLEMMERYRREAERLKQSPPPG